MRFNLHYSCVESTADALYNNLIHAKKLYDVKLEILKGLSVQYVDYVKEWNQLDREWSFRNGAVFSVYRYNQTKGMCYYAHRLSLSDNKKFRHNLRSIRCF